MRKIIILSFVAFSLLSCSANSEMGNEKISEYEGKFNVIAQRFAYQEHISYKAKTEMCGKLIEIFTSLPEQTPDRRILDLKSKIYTIGNSSGTCAAKTYAGNHIFKDWDKIIAQKKQLHFHGGKCSDLKVNNDWVLVFLLTDEYTSLKDEQCKKAWALVEPHYSQAYKMRNWE